VELPCFHYLVNHFILKAWGKQIKDGKASKEAPSAPLAVRLSTKNGATGGSSSGGGRRGGGGGGGRMGLGGIFK